MQREATLAGVMVALLVAMAVGAAAVPDALSEPREDIRPADLDLRETTVSATEVRGETVTLALDSRLAHRGATSENVTVEVRAIDGDTGLVATTERQTLGSLEGTKEVSVTTNISVERAGDYRLETIVYADERRQSFGRTRVSNVGALTPAYAESSVSFHQFENSETPLQPIAYRIENVAANQTTMNVSVYLTNRGDDPAGDVTLALRARQADSNVIADEATRQVGQIAPGRTATVHAELTVPDGYNYWLDGILKSDGVIVGTQSAPANLDPTETLSANETTRDVGFESGDFERETEMARETEAARERTPTSGSGPGMTAVTAVVAALVAAALLARRRR